MHWQNCYTSRFWIPWKESTTQIKTIVILGNFSRTFCGILRLVFFRSSDVNVISQRCLRVTEEFLKKHCRRKLVVSSGLFSFPKPRWRMTVSKNLIRHLILFLAPTFQPMNYWPQCYDRKPAFKRKGKQRIQQEFS